jgi:hypothetical protein
MENNLQGTEPVIKSLPEQIKEALDGRSQRWLALEVKMHEQDLSRKMNGHDKCIFSDDEIRRINQRLNANITR